MRRPVAIITPFKSVNLLNNDANLLSPDTVIDNVASRLREISDDFDQRYGARNAANVDFIIAGFGGIIWGFMRVSFCIVVLICFKLNLFRICGMIDCKNTGVVSLVYN